MVSTLDNQWGSSGVYRDFIGVYGDIQLRVP